MGDGKCGAKHYGGIDEQKMNQVVETLRENGNTVSGGNPYTVDTGQFGIKLKGTWDEGGQSLTVIVTDKAMLVPCGKIWDKIDPLLRKLASS
jgi:hypothetical protein